MYKVPKMNWHPSLTLSPEGDSVTINDPQNMGTDVPEIGKAAACKTRDEVLAFLISLRQTNLQSDLAWLHRNSNYKGHKGPKISSHSCKLEDQIAFVQARIASASRSDSMKKWKCCSWCP